MKFRNGFVTNSSSSSFICQICGYVTGGYNYSLEDVGFVECVNGHEFCQEHVINIPEGMYPWDFFNTLPEGRYEIPEENCPICKMTLLTDEDYIAILHKKGIIKQDVFEEVKEKFGTYDKLQEYLKGE